MVARKKKEQVAEIAVDGMTEREARIARIEAVRKALLDAHGSPVVRNGSEVVRSIEVFSTRVPSLDIALGVGGVPRGRVTELFGPERGGKTTLALQTAASCLEQGGIVLYIDSEHALDPAYCKALGVDLSDPGFLIVQEDTADEALSAALALLAEDAVDMIVIDSLANLIPKTSYEKVVHDGVGSSIIGAKARLQTQFIEAAIGAVCRSNVALVLVQQMRTIMKPGTTPREDSATVAASMRHNTSVRVKVSRVKDNDGSGNKTDETYAGRSQETIAKVVKNKVAPPFRQALYTVEYGKGVLYWADLFDACIVAGVPNAVPGTKPAIVSDDGEVLGRFYRKDIDAFFAERPDVGVMLVDKLSDVVGIELWDPVRGCDGRRIGIRPDRVDGPQAEEVVADGD